VRCGGTIPPTQLVWSIPFSNQFIGGGLTFRGIKRPGYDGQEKAVRWTPMEIDH